jgi:hypothetical protein
MPTIDEIQTKTLDYVQAVQAPVVEYVGKAAGALADALPADRPELLTTVIGGVADQAAFAKTVLDAEAAFAKAVIDAAVKPFVPAKKRTVKAA